MVQFMDENGGFDGFFPALLQTHKEAKELAEKLQEEKGENTLVAKHINI